MVEQEVATTSWTIKQAPTKILAAFWFSKTSLIGRKLAKAVPVEPKAEEKERSNPGTCITPDLGVPFICFGETHDQLVKAGMHVTAVRLIDVPRTDSKRRPKDLLKLHVLYAVGPETEDFSDGFTPIYEEILNLVFRHCHLHDNDGHLSVTLLYGEELAYVPNGTCVGSVKVDGTQVSIRRGEPKQAANPRKQK